MLNGKFYNEKIDIWGAGCVLYFMLIGTSPFFEEKVSKLNKRIIDGNFHANSLKWISLSEEC